MPNHFVLEKEGRIATLTFNRPEKRNPTGTGNTFSAGADLTLVKGITDKEEHQRIFAPLGKRRARLIGRVLRVLVNLEQVTVAAVNGYAIGGGWSLAFGCDLRIAVEGAEFWFPEVDLGVPLSPDSTALLTAHVGPALAKEIIITCRHFKAEELLPLGLVNRVVKKAELTAIVRELAQSLANKNATAVMVSKATVNALALSQAVIRPDLLLTRE